MKTLAIVLAAGEGKGMHSYVNQTSKLAFNVLDKPIISYVQKRIQEVAFDQTLYVVGYQAKQIMEILGSANFIYQEKINGTFSALSLAYKYFKDYDDIVVIYGSMPTLTSTTLLKMLEVHQKQQNDISYIGGVFLIRSKVLQENCPYKVDDAFEDINNWIDCMKQDGKNVQKLEFVDENEAFIIKNRIDLAKANQIIQQRINQKHMLNGITIVDPNTTYIGEDVKIGNDTIVYPNTYIYGKSMIGVSCELGPNTYIVDSLIDNGALIYNKVIKHQTITKNHE